MKLVAIAMVGILLCACESEAERKAKWLAFCVEGEFTAKQCEVLYSLKKSSDDAEASAGVAAFMSGAAAGASVGRR